MKTHPEQFPELLKYFRLMRAITQTQLGQTVGLESSLISHFEAGRRSPSLMSLCRLSDALSVSIDALVGRK